jgi:hypothetical protein
LAILPSCASEPSADQRTAAPIIATRVDPNVDFGSFTTFAIDPIVTTTSDATGGGVAGPAATAIIIDSIAANMRARGYQQVDPASSPNLGINATIFTRLKAETNVTAGFWWGLPGYGGTPAFWGVPAGTYYSPWTYESQAFKSTTLIIQIVDLRDPMSVAVVSRTHAIDAGAFSDGGVGVALDVAWTALLHGFVAADFTLLPAVPAAIDQAFAQSPYIQRR